MNCVSYYSVRTLTISANQSQRHESRLEESHMLFIIMCTYVNQTAS